MNSSRQNVGLEDAARLLDLVPYIISHQGISLNELAAQFSVTTDEITSDLTTLWMCGLPGYTAYELIDLSFDSGYVTISNASTLQRPRNLERNEALALLLGLETLSEEVDSSNEKLSQDISSLISRISHIVDQSAALRVKAGTPSSSVIRAKIDEAMKSRQLLKITYHSSSRDSVSERLIEPLELVTRNEVEYVDAFCLSTGGYRTFRVDRILSTEVGSNADLNRPVSTSSDQSPATQFTLTIGARARDIVEKFSIDEADIGADGQVEAQSYSTEWALREVMSLGGAATISSPESLRSAARLKAIRALDGYVNQES